MVYHGASQESHTHLKIHVYTKKIQLTSGIFYDIPPESVASGDLRPTSRRSWAQGRGGGGGLTPPFILGKKRRNDRRKKSRKGK